MRDKSPLTGGEALPNDLAGLRREIEKIDANLLQVFTDRMKLARAVADVKAKKGTPIFDPERENELVRLAVSQVVPADALRAESLLRSLMRLSRSAQYEIVYPIARDFSLGRRIIAAEQGWPEIRQAVFQGSAGAYAGQACRRLFPDIPAMAVNTWEEACRIVEAGQADVAVLPLDNSTAGTVDDVYELLLKYDLHIWRSLSLKIEHCLLGKPGSTMDGIRTVISHPQALAQCSDLIRSRGWVTRESLNTAFAAEACAAGADLSLAAIASDTAAAANGLEILARGINNTHVNQTRFIAIGTALRISDDADRVSLVLSLPHRSGSLAGTLSIFGDRGLNLTKIQSRPDLENPWTYLFYVDFECPVQRQDAALATLCQLSSELPMLRFLGWYHEEA
jgi:chorismate mutase / prephenate dehydratase